MKSKASNIHVVATSAHFSGHETFPLRQMWLKKAYDRGNSHLIPKDAFTADHAIAAFGVGKNMVASIRHWALACGVIRETDEGFLISGLANQILHNRGFDP